MTKARRALIPVLLAVLAVPSLARSGARDHDGGFFLRLALGGGHAESEIDSAGQSLKFSGSGVELDLAIGGMVSENLALHGSIFGWLISDPDVEASGPIQGSAEVSGDLDMTAFGAGITYYFMPVNIYLSGSAGVGVMSGDGDIDGETDSGFAGMITLGKEWWVSGGWGLGLAGVFGFHSLPDKDIDESWSGWNFSVIFSATLN